MGNNNKGGNREAGDESNEREDVTDEIKGQRTGLMRGQWLAGRPVLSLCTGVNDRD